MENWHGSFAIPMTPFDEHDRIDSEVLAAEIEFCIQSSVGGIIVPILVSEFQALSEDERRLMVQVSVEQARGRVPIIANAAGVNTHQAVGYARYAQEIGADGIIAMPPYALHPDTNTIISYFKAINDAVNLPIMIQNAGIVSLSPDMIIRLCTELEHVSWVKEEVNPPTHSISNLIARNSPAIHGVMGGSGGRYLITEYSRGSKGCIHACQFCDIIQKIWDLLEENHLPEAGDLFEKVLPGLVLEGVMGMAYSKEIMVRRGIFKNNRMRMQTNSLDASDLKEIDRTWERIQPYLIWH
jgi:4-hydroxy-tetrahydrodipicolinate synthase